jgi:hypothetical protein
MRSDLRVRELTNTLDAINQISRDMMWNSSTLSIENSNSRLRQTEQLLGRASSIHTLSSKYVQGLSKSKQGGAELNMLVERGIVWTTSMLWNVERDPQTREIWLATPDLKPDISDSIMGEIVGNNLRRGKSYKYFIPDSLGDPDDLVLQLTANLNIDKARSKSGDRISIVGIDAAAFRATVGAGNVIFFFKANPMASKGMVFREIVFTRVAGRGVFWQEWPDTEADELYRFLRSYVTPRHS